MSTPGTERRPWHDGERRARELAGGPEIAPVIRPFMTAQLRDFLQNLPLVFVAGLDAEGRPAASILRGDPGFIACPTENVLEIAAAFQSGDFLGEALRPGAPFGVIGVDFSARRRNRVNGQVLHASATRIVIAVSEAFGNCPKYISPQACFAAPAMEYSWSPLSALDAEAKDRIARANVFFIATRGPDGIDISHRGGEPGFVDIAPDGTLKIVDYRGNNFFNTFGNLLHDPSAALLFPDFATGTALHLSGKARIYFSGAERSWTFAPEAVRLLHAGASES